MEDRLLNVQEAADYLGISPHTINAWKSMKKIRYIKLGRRTLFDFQDLIDLKESLKVQPTNPHTIH